MQVNEQVMVRRQMHNGVLVRIGSILSIDPEGGTAVVHFPIDHSQATLPVEELEPTSNRFTGRARVQPNPVVR